MKSYFIDPQNVHDNLIISLREVKRDYKYKQNILREQLFED